MLSFYYFLWFAPQVLLGTSLVLLLRGRVYNRLPFFCVYVGFNLVNFVLLLSVSKLAAHVSPSPFHVYQSFALACLASDVILQYLVIYELAKELLIHLTFVKKLFPVVRWIAASLVLAAAALAALLPQSGIGRLMSAFQTLQFSANLIYTFLLLLLLSFSRALNVSWKSLPAGIALGLGIWSSAEMASSAFYSLVGKPGPGYLAIDLVRSTAFLLCTVIWLVYILRPQRSPKFTGTRLELSELELLDQQVQRMLRP